MPDLDLSERLPSVFPSYDDETDFSKWLKAHQDEIDALDADLDAVQESLQIAHATGDALDEIGKDFGLLGKRRGRSDDAYRQFLMSLLRAYSGRGTPPGVRTAVSGGILAEPSDVDFIEDFQANRYEIVLYDWEPHQTETVRRLAEISDPSVIKHRDPIHYILADVGITISGEETNLADHQEAESAGLRLSASPSGVQTLSTIGLSSSELEPLSTTKWRLSADDIAFWSSGAATLGLGAQEAAIRPMTTSPVAALTARAEPTEFPTNRESTAASPNLIVGDTRTVSSAGLSASDLDPLSADGWTLSNADA